jgi:hypothetical protein
LTVGAQRKLADQREFVRSRAVNPTPSAQHASAPWRLRPPAPHS